MSKIEISVNEKEDLKNKKYEDHELSWKLDELLKAEEMKEDKNLMKQVKAYAEKKKQKITSIADLRKLQEKPNYGIEDSESEEMDEGDTETSDDKASVEAKESRVKSSKNPTTVGKVMK